MLLLGYKSGRMYKVKILLFSITVTFLVGCFLAISSLPSGKPVLRFPELDLNPLVQICAYLHILASMHLIIDNIGLDIITFFLKQCY